MNAPLARKSRPYVFAGQTTSLCETCHALVPAKICVDGDLVFYENTYGPGITHVGIYIGNNQWVSAENEASGVKISSLDEPYWKARYAGARRIT